MRLRTKVIGIAIAVSLLGLAVVGIQKTPGLDWRARVIWLKASGQISELAPAAGTTCNHS